MSARAAIYDHIWPIWQLWSACLKGHCTVKCAAAVAFRRLQAFRPNVSRLFKGAGQSGRCLHALSTQLGSFDIAGAQAEVAQLEIS